MIFNIFNFFSSINDTHLLLVKTSYTVQPKTNKSYPAPKHSYTDFIQDFYKIVYR